MSSEPGESVRVTNQYFETPLRQLNCILRISTRMKEEKRNRQTRVGIFSTSTSFTKSFIFVRILPNSMGSKADHTLYSFNVKPFSLPSLQEIYN